MFGSKQRKAKLLFGLSDVFLTVSHSRAPTPSASGCHLENNFFLLPEQKALILGFSAAAFVVIGYWLNIYGKVDSARIRTILRRFLPPGRLQRAGACGPRLRSQAGHQPRLSLLLRRGTWLLLVLFPHRRPAI